VDTSPPLPLPHPNPPTPIKFLFHHSDLCPCKGVRYSPPLFINIIVIVILIIITTTILTLSGVMKSVYRCCENGLFHIAKVQDRSRSRKVKQTTTRGIRSERRFKGIYSRHNANLPLLN
jgi:hypothetical protein